MSSCITPIYLLIGAPGSGKTTQAQLVAERQKMHYISAGDLLRQNASEEIKTNVMHQGGLVDHNYINQLLGQAIVNYLGSDQTRPILLDGFPRSVERAEWLVDNWGDHLQLCWLLDLSRQAVERRLSQRARDDDKLESIDHRWQIYTANTPPVLEILNLAGVRTVVVDADQPEEDVYRQMVEELSQ